MPALVKAIKEKRFKQARLLVASGYNINDKDKESGYTALIASCLLEDERKACCIIKWLLRHGACLLTPDIGGLTPLMYACKHRKHRIVELILKEKELDLRAQDNDGNSALLYATKAGNLRITKIILREFVRRRVQGQDLANNAGETPLILAAKLGHWECCNVLLQGGKASPYARDFEMKMTAEEWKMATLESNDALLPSRKNSSEGLSKQKIITGQVRRRNGKWCSVELEPPKGQNVIVDGGDQNSTANRQAYQPLVHSKSNHFHHSRCIGITNKYDERSGTLLDKRRDVIEMGHKYGGQEEVRRNTTAITQVQDFRTRSYTSQGLRSNVVVHERYRQRVLKSRKNDRSMSAPQRAYVNHVSRLRKTYDKKSVNILGRNEVPDWTQPKRQKSFLNNQLPSLLRVLGDQQSPSYRVKAKPPTPEQSPSPSPAPEPLAKDTDARRKDILKRFAKAGFASIVMSKLAVGRRESGTTERSGKISPLFGATKGRTRPNSCKSDGSSYSAKSWLI